MARGGHITPVHWLLVLVTAVVLTLASCLRVPDSDAPKEIDYLFNAGPQKGKTQKGLYKFEGDTFIDCCTEPGQERPTEFKSTKENGYEIMTAKRVKKVD